MKNKFSDAPLVNKSYQDDSQSIKSNEQEIIKKGSKVIMKGQQLPGEVLEINKKNVKIAFGDLVTATQIDKLEIISEKEFKKHIKNSGISIKSDENIYRKKLNFKPDIDLRGKRAEEALQELNVFLDNAILVNAKELRILHGKGNGILKEVIRDYLRTQDFVISIKDEHVEFGGAGITVVTMAF